MSMQNKPETLTASQKQLLLGTMLGDGSMQVSSAAKQTVCYRSNHGWCQHQYNLEKYALLAEYATRAPYKIKNGGYGEWSSVWRTQALSVFHYIFTLTCPDGHHKLVNTEWLSQLTPEGIAWWIGDDGCLDSGRRTVSISTHGFSPEEVDLLSTWLMAKYGVESKVYMVNKTRDGEVFTYPLLYITAKGTITLIPLIAPYMPAPMAYKINRIEHRCLMCGAELTKGAWVCEGACKEEYDHIVKHEYYEENKEYIMEKSAEWRRANPEQSRIIARRCYYKDLVYSRAMGRKHAAAYLERNRDLVNERKRDKRTSLKGDPAYEASLQSERKRYYAKLKKDQGRYRDRLDKANARRDHKAEAVHTKEWRKNNPDKVKEQNARSDQRRKERLANDPAEKERQRLITNARHKRKILAKGPTGHCRYCGEPLYKKTSTVCQAEVCQKLKLRDNQRRYRARKLEQA